MKNSNEDELWYNFNRAMIELGWAGKKSHETAGGLALANETAKETQKTQHAD